MGWNLFEQTNVPVGLTAITAIDGGIEHSLALVGAAPRVSGHGRFNTDGNGQVSVTLSNQIVTLGRIRGQRITFTGEVASVTGTGNTATLTGTGSWNGASGYAFEASVVDNVRWGRLEDTIEVVIRNPAGFTVFTTSGPQLLKPGDIAVVTAQ